MAALFRLSGVMSQYTALWSIGLISQFLNNFTDGRTPRTGDQPVARPLPNHRAIQTQNKRIHTPHIHALCGIQTHDPGFRASEDSTWLRPLGSRDRLTMYRLILIMILCDMGIILAQDKPSILWKVIKSSASWKAGFSLGFRVSFFLQKDNCATWS
jgi:hypothetical protein